jgi:hypothetical protein
LVIFPSAGQAHRHGPSRLIQPNPKLKRLDQVTEVMRLCRNDAKGTGGNEGNRAVHEAFPRLSLARTESPFGVAAQCSANLISFSI